MSEKVTNSEQFEIILPEAVIPVKIGTGYYQRIQNIIAFLIAGKTNGEITNAHKAIESDSVEPMSWIEHYETILILCKEFESRVREEGFVKSVTEEELKKMD